MLLCVFLFTDQRSSALNVQPPKRRPRRWASLLLGILFIAIAVVAITLIPPAIDTRHVTIEPTPGQVSLPPTATPPHEHS